MKIEISAENRRQLLAVAREIVTAKIEGREANIPKIDGLDFNNSCFVSLRLNNRLRGCIGNFRTDINIVNNIASMAYESAFNDPRFHSLTPEELKDVRFEISVLSHMIPINSVEEVEVGRDGLYIVKGYNKGVLLPQVATDHKWDKYEFISQTCLKAGLKKHAWEYEKIELYRFEAIVFGEKDPVI
jgi:AmmeMemoRadiSam system protein A